MRRIIIFTLLALMMAGGVAAADRYRHRNGHRDHRGGAYVQRTYPRGGYQRPYYQSRHVYQPTVRVVRRPIYVQRPVISYRYYNYYQRPAIIAESYPSMAGYIWVAGQWQWNGYEWIWQPGHYQPDAAYDQYNYNYAPGPTSGSVYYDGSYGY